MSYAFKRNAIGIDEALYLRVKVCCVGIAVNTPFGNLQHCRDTFHAARGGQSMTQNVLEGVDQRKIGSPAPERLTPIADFIRVS